MDFEPDITTEPCNVNTSILSSTPPSSDDTLTQRTSPARPATILRSRRAPVMPTLSTSPSSAPSLDTNPLQQQANTIVHTPALPLEPSPSSPLSSCTASPPASPPPMPCTTTTSTKLSVKERKHNTTAATTKELGICIEHPASSITTINQQDCSSPPQQIDISDFECPLCFQVFLQPVTTPCGHVFCKQCLFRALKHSSSCPLCRHKFDPSGNQKYSVNIVLMSVIEKYFPKEHRERVAEEEDVQKAEEPLKSETDENMLQTSPSNWSCILPSLRSTCTVLLSCGGF